MGLIRAESRLMRDMTLARGKQDQVVRDLRRRNLALREGLRAVIERLTLDREGGCVVSDETARTIQRAEETLRDETGD